MKLIPEKLELGYKLTSVLKFETEMTVNNQSEDILIYGKNGAGKTTLLKTLAGLIHPTKGELDPELKQFKINYISEDLTFHDDIKIKHIFKSMIKGSNYNKVIEIAKKIKLDIAKPWRSLSKGNKQRTRLLIGAFNPNALGQIQLYDEPLSGLDNKTCKFFTKLWKSQKEDESINTGIRIFSMHGEHVKQLNWDQEWEILGDGGGDQSIAVLNNILIHSDN